MSPEGCPTVYLYWQDAQQILQTADILICRASSLGGMTINRVTRSEYSHAAMCGWAHGPYGNKRMLRQCETIGHRDAREINLRDEIRKWPGLYDVYRVDTETFPHFDPEGAWLFMKEACGSGYGWRNIFRVWARRRLGRWIPPLFNRDDPCAPRDCSALVQAAVRCNGGPSWAEFDCDVVPGMLAERFTKYIGTLFYRPVRRVHTYGLPI